VEDVGGPGNIDHRDVVVGEDANPVRHTCGNAAYVDRYSTSMKRRNWRDLWDTWQKEPSPAAGFSPRVDLGPGSPRPGEAKEFTMPFVNVKLVEGVFTEEEKHEMAAALTDVMVKFEGSEAFREVVWVLIEELHSDGWHIGGRPFRGPASLMDTLGRSASIVETIDGHPTTRPALAKAAPVTES
jgi:4-oxalocrotonate tautomerase